jgi:hypothetical protein
MPWITVCKKEYIRYHVGEVLRVTKSKDIPKHVDVFTMQNEYKGTILQSQCREIFIEPIWTSTIANE